MNRIVTLKFGHKLKARRSASNIYDSMRNVFCPEYSVCLNKAIEEDSKGWTCAGCSREFERDLDTFNFRATQDLLLLCAVFFKDTAAYRRYLKEKEQGY